jgi:membrane-bound serine protease (ClpP class)
MLAALFWSMSDLWPNEPLTIAWSADAFEKPTVNLGLGVIIAVALGGALLRFLPRGWIWDRLVVEATIGGSAQEAGSNPGAGPGLDALIGREGVVATTLRPAGQVDLGGRRYAATVEVGTVETGDRVVVRGRTDFGLIVEKSGQSN